MDDAFHPSFEKLRESLRREREDQQQMLELSGIMESVVTSSYLH